MVFCLVFSLFGLILFLALWTSFQELSIVFVVRFLRFCSFLSRGCNRGIQYWFVAVSAIVFVCSIFFACDGVGGCICDPWRTMWREVLIGLESFVHSWRVDEAVMRVYVGR